MPEASPLASLNRWARGMAKSLAARTGAVRLYRNMRDRDALTVIMLHRVLPMAMYAKREPDPGYTISTELLERLVPFLRANYTIVSLSDVLDARRGTRRLPARPLLITFDDGWDDNVRYAAPIFAAFGVPWTLFVAAGAVGTGGSWWQETILKALRTGRASYQELWQMAAAGTAAAGAFDGDSELALLNAFGALDPQRRDGLLTRLCEHKSESDMADWDGLRGLGGNVSIGVHGFSHLPLTMLDSPERDLSAARELLRSHLGDAATITMSFPHGRYDAKALTSARALDFELMFTSDAVLNNCPGGWLPYDTIGRISVETSRICNSRGEFEPGDAERWLMLRKRKSAA
jgi:peptidoglycan/xylan/chitin deacetylase (PgdA/CDA1 family)